MSSQSVADPLYANVLRDVWERLAPSIRRLHNGGDHVGAHGILRVSHGQGWRARLLARALRLPRAAAAVDMRLTIVARDGIESWDRSFDGRQILTTQHLSEECGLVERFGLLEFRFDLDECAGSLLYVQREVAVRFWPLRIRLPWQYAPRIEAREDPVGPDGVDVTVRVAVPVLGEVIAYDGVVRVQDVSA